MVKEKQNPKEWEIGDTFYYQDKDYNKELNCKYIIFIKSGIVNNVPLFRVKVTKDSKLPRTIEELESIDYARTGLVIWESRFLPLGGNIPDRQLIIERNKVKFYPDENGFLYIYQVSIDIKSKRSIPKEWGYLGKFDLSLPKDEFIPFSLGSIWGFIWNIGKNWFFDRLLMYNSEKKENIELGKKRRVQETGAMKLILSYNSRNSKDEVDELMDIITAVK